MHTDEIKYVPNLKEEETSLKVGDSLGAFAGYLRRPKSSATGLTAQIFGENGDDADVIAALHLSRFLDAHVKITIWMMKNRVGKITKVNGEYIKLTEFVGKIRRPLPSNFGQTAQFFGENGPNADAINILNKSDYLDALVFVEMHQALPGMTSKDIDTGIPDNLDEHSSKMTTTQKEEFKKMQKKAEEGIRMLETSGFFRNERVLSVLGKETDYKQWLSTQNCCHPGREACTNDHVFGWKVPDVKRNSFLPLCSKHMEEWENGVVELPDGGSSLSFAQTQSIFYLQRWAKYELHKKLNVPANSLPTPGVILTFCIDNNLQSLIPSSFKALIV